MDHDCSAVWFVPGLRSVLQGDPRSTHAVSAASCHRVGTFGALVFPQSRGGLLLITASLVFGGWHIRCSRNLIAIQVLFCIREEARPLAPVADSGGLRICLLGRVCDVGTWRHTPRPLHSAGARRAVRANAGGLLFERGTLGAAGMAVGMVSSDSPCAVFVIQPFPPSASCGSPEPAAGG